MKTPNYATTGENPAEKESTTFSLLLIVHPVGSEIYQYEMRKQQEGRRKRGGKERERRGEGSNLASRDMC